MAHGEITSILQRWSDGDSTALESLLPLVYSDLRKLARAHIAGERAGATLQPTALVHEAYLRLCGQENVNWQNRAQFFGIFAQMMRRVLVDVARRHKASKRGGGAPLAEFDEAYMASEEKREEWLAVNEALDKFEKIDPERARIVELRYFAGFSVEEIAALLAVSTTTIKRDWAVARSWLYRALKDSGHGNRTLE